MPLRRLRVGSVFLVVLAAGCRKEPEPVSRGEVPPASPASASGASLPPDVFLAPPKSAPAPREDEKTLRWTDPPGWTRAPSTSAMRLATYRVPKAAGDADGAELTVFHFGPGQGGSVDANFDRWVSQFKDLDRSKAQRSERAGAGFNQHLLQIDSGVFASSMGPGAAEGSKPNYGMLAAIVDTPSGPYFFKLTGGAATVKHEHGAFLSLLDSLKM